jgi:hypothetical protein
MRQQKRLHDGLTEKVISPLLRRGHAEGVDVALEWTPPAVLSGIEVPTGDANHQLTNERSPDMESTLIAVDTAKLVFEVARSRFVGQSGATFEIESHAVFGVSGHAGKSFVCAGGLWRCPPLGAGDAALRSLGPPSSGALCLRLPLSQQDGSDRLSGNARSGEESGDPAGAGEDAGTSGDTGVASLQKFMDGNPYGADQHPSRIASRIRHRVARRCRHSTVAYARGNRRRRRAADAAGCAADPVGRDPCAGAAHRRRRSTARSHQPEGANESQYGGLCIGQQTRTYRLGHLASRRRV